MRIKLPRWDKNSVIGHEQLNQLAEAIERADSWQVDGSSGLQMVESRVNRTISFAGRDFALYAKVNTAITAMSGNTLGQGKIDLQIKDENGVLTPVGGDPEPCFNSTLVSVAAGQIIQVKWVQDAWAVDVVRCSS